MTIQIERTQHLSPAEMDVLQLVAIGLSNQAIACRLFISPRTVEGRLASIYTKWDLTDRGESNSRVSATIRYLATARDVTAGADRATA